MLLRYNRLHCQGIKICRGAMKLVQSDNYATAHPYEPHAYDNRPASDTRGGADCVVSYRITGSR